MIGPARVSAFHILTAVSSGHADLSSAIADSRAKLGDDRDRALAGDIATGVQRWRATLDHVIGAFSKRPVDRLDREVLEVLRLSAYQLLHHDRVPASAVVDDAVSLTRRAGKGSASGFVNAVLRNISRKRAALPLPERPAHPADRAAALDYLSITWSHPRWLVERWYDRLGFDAAESWVRFNNSPAPLTLRRNALRVTRDELLARMSADDIALVPAAFAPDAFIVADGRPLAGPGLAEGWFVPQDEASQLVTLLAGPTPGPRILDTCASPGGKTTALAARAEPGARIVACDVRVRRVDLLRQVVAACGATNVSILQADLLQPLPFRTMFDCVFVDAPCSGLGTLRRDPDIKWRRHERDLAGLAQSERRMLANAADAVGSSGRLVYATCSSEPDENDAVIEAFLAARPDFHQVDARVAAPDLPAAVVDAHGYFRTSPHLHGLESFFGAVCERHA